MKTTTTKLGITYHVYQLIDDDDRVVEEFVNKKDMANRFSVSERMVYQWFKKGDFNRLGKHYRINIISYPVLLIDDDKLKVYEGVGEVAHEYLKNHNAKLYDHLATGTNTFVGRGTDFIVIKQFGKEHNFFGKEDKYSRNELARLKNQGTVSIRTKKARRKPRRLPGQPDYASEEDRKKQRELLRKIEQVPNLMELDKDCELFIQFRSLLSYCEDDEDDEDEVVGE